MQSHFLNLPSNTGRRRLHFTQWGDGANTKVLVCVHGLTRTCRDFDRLAEAMSDRYRVICPDIVGRGESDWLENKADYSYPQYVADMTALIAFIAVDTVHWVGTSMGGIIGMLIASQPATPITRMVVNDVGAFIPKASLERIGAYMGPPPVFASIDAAAAALRAVSPFGPLSDDDWRRITEPMVKSDGKGSWVLRYDPAIGDPFKTGPITDVDLSPFWEAIRCPVLVTRGTDSDLLLKSTYQQMCAKPGVRGVEFANTGHAPMFQDTASIAIIRDFLLAGV
jgi:pimeloyl-ACP methyl ester carboxylesterase